MSKTYRDKRNYKFRKQAWPQDRLSLEYEVEYLDYYTKEPKLGKRYYYLQVPTTKPKVKKSVDNEWHWLRGAPSWWTNLFMNRPIRRKMQSYCRNVVKSQLDELDSLLEPSNSKKPHQYYWYDW